ncbi:hypothetical protein CONCODRAFT_10174 [Conidiobolus coronatus NRRL 28638]|uniref:RNI-like protein n=1 Tax=Conidiobolus coronatus (strain ATCC 28846 / CBS 209.66 / NRRL 28638) TaxID=796925 RepID=A0A137NYD5_CONC2|nr:hypothetical protein CONCODRAFT_10174 [Conidiobolus coronatus NRRL 28638]|eukprot:KXN67722.1 hypothetical protein CONCODRAFT_10174 [Conidiobolus coronatus NRRL 28638]
MNSILTHSSLNITTNTNIDWEITILNGIVHEYLNKQELSEISLTTRRIRRKLYPLLFTKLRTNPKVLYSMPNFFQHRDNFDFDRLSYSERYRANKAQIDPFFTQATTELERVAKTCKVLNLDQLRKVCYFLIPITSQFLNLYEIYIYNCYLPFYKLNDILKNLSKLEVLKLDHIILLKSTEESELPNDLGFPPSLKSLIYGNVKLVVNDSPQLHTAEFVYNQIPFYSGIRLDLLPQNIPLLNSLTYSNYNPSQNLIKFLGLNSHLEDLTLSITQLTPSTLSALSSISNLECLKLETNDLSFEVPYITPGFNNPLKLKDLTLILLNSSDFNIAKQFIQLTPNLTKLTIRALNDQLFEEFNYLINTLNYFAKYEDTFGGFNFITRVYTK